MGRGRGKGKKLSITNHEDIAVSGSEDEKVLVQKRRGRPQKLPKHNFNEEVEKVEDDGSDNTNNGVSNEEVKNPNAAEHERKRKQNSQAKEKSESIEVENGAGNRSNSTNESSKSNGFRHIRSRRKSKPCRAAGTGVLCK